MVGKIVKSSAPGRCAEYCLNHDDARLLAWKDLDITKEEARNLAESTGEERIALARVIARNIDTSFSVQSSLNRAVEKPVGHIPVCFMKEDSPLLDDNRMRQIAREYMEMMGYQNTQYMLVRHFNEKGNPHLHIFFNRVDNDGKCLNAWQDYKRNALACKELTKKHGLHFSNGRRNTVVKDLRGVEKIRYEISNAIDAALETATTWQNVHDRLNEQGLFMSIVQNESSGRKGVKFGKYDPNCRNELQTYAFRGADIGRRYTYGQIEQVLQRNSQKQEQEKKQKQPSGCTCEEEHKPEVRHITRMHR